MRLVGVVDPNTVRADAIAREFSCKAFGSVEQMLTTHSEVQAASVAVPTVLHLEVARSLLEAGVDVLIEKPLAARLSEAQAIRLCEASRSIFRWYRSVCRPNCLRCVGSGGSAVSS